VELSRRSGASSAAGLVNAVLRKVNRDPVEWPDRATELCMPQWMLTRWESAYGREIATRIAQACLVPPETYIRVPAGREAEALALGAEPAGVTGCFRLLGDNAGPFRMQDIGSQCVVPLLGLQPGMRVLDLCAGAGGKTAQALETGVNLVAADSDHGRLQSAPGNRVLLDGTRDLPFGRQFDRILVDAPCSGTGTLRRNPEIRWRVQYRDLLEYQERQVALVCSALRHLASGGRLVYATCSLEREENEWVIEEVRKQHPGVEIEAEMRRIPGMQPGDGFFATVLRSQ
jgi:16S rRNA (cytosine967-C5)-methyltransferase